MGQLYNRRPRKAFSLALITYILDFLMVKTRLLFAFSTMVVTILGLARKIHDFRNTEGLAMVQIR